MPNTIPPSQSATDLPELGTPARPEALDDGDKAEISTLLAAVSADTGGYPFGPE